ncbi:MAG TPA: c-type cytochrome [Thermoanaerobaculia bacterium]|nr:c-type cytochrome [Thermoanaerobaculia bacterium]
MTTSFPSLPQSPRTRGLAVVLLGLLTLLTALAAGASAPEPPKPAAPAKAAAPAAGASAVAHDGEPTAEKKFKNIKVLRSMPASQMIPVMHLFEASLGVSCNFCHVTEGEQFELDTKKEKETAREMIRMVMDINKNNFDGRTVVTCNTCHGGKERPVPVPPIPQGQLAEKAQAEPETREKLPSASQILDRYVEALGGRAALLAVKSRVSRGTLLHAKVVDAGTAKSAVVNRGQEDPLEITQQWPGKVTVVLGPPSWRLVERLDGASGTVEMPSKESRPMTGPEVARFTALGDLRRDLDLQDRADKVRVGGKDKIDGREVYILRAPTTEGGRELLYFDVQTGLLRRRLAFRQTVIGNDPEQTDLDDYRPTGGKPGGVKVPFVVKVSYLDDNHLGTTRKLTEVRDNVAP